MVDCHSANWAIGMDVLMALALVTLLLKWAAGLNEVVFPTVFAGAFKLSQGGRRGVCLHSRAPSIITGALGGNKGDSRGKGVREWGLDRVKEEMVDAGVDTGTEQMPLTRYLLFPSTAKGSLSSGNILALNGLLYYRGSVMANLSYDTNVLKASEGIVY